MSRSRDPAFFLIYLSWFIGGLKTVVGFFGVENVPTVLILPEFTTNISSISETDSNICNVVDCSLRTKMIPVGPNLGRPNVGTLPY